MAVYNDKRYVTLKDLPGVIKGTVGSTTQSGFIRFTGDIVWVFRQHELELAIREGWIGIQDIENEGERYD